MKEQLIEILGLDSKAEEKDIVKAVQALKAAADTRSAKDAGEKEITDLIQRSGGALNRDGAKMVLKDRRTHAAKQAEEAKKAKK